MSDKIHTPPNECGQEYLTQRGIGLHHVLEIAPLDFEQRARFARPAPHQAPPSRKLIHFAREIAAAEHSNYSLIRVGNADNLDAAVEHHKDAPSGVSLVEKNFTG